MSNALVIQQHTVTDMERMARAFVTSKLFGVQNAEQALALCLVAQAEGRHPASAAQDYHIIQGKPSKKADAMLRDFLSAGGKVQWHQLDNEVADATFSHPAGGSVRISWDHERAKQAQIKTPMWTKYPRQMLRARVVSEGVRTVFPMATSGMYVPEEVAAFDDVKDAGTAAKEVTVVTADGEVIEPTLPKAKTRDLYAEMQAELDACMTIEDLGRLWNSPAFKSELKTLKPDWQEMLTERKDTLKAAFDASMPAIPPNFDNYEPEPLT